MSPKQNGGAFIAPAELIPFEIINADCPSNLILICDHAANTIPSELNCLGLKQAQLDTHIAWDLGAAKVAKGLARLLQAPLVLSGYSRLIIDCNRPLHSEELIPLRSAGVDIPGNQNLSALERAARIEQFYNPYHKAIEQLISRRSGLGAPFLPRILLSIHSFTPVLNNTLRPWHIGLAARFDMRLLQGLFKLLSRSGEIEVGFNQPYAIDDNYDYSLPKHAETAGILNAMIEIRQDGITTDEQVARWVERIAEALTELVPRLINSPIQ